MIPLPRGLHSKPFDFDYDYTVVDYGTAIHAHFVFMVNAQSMGRSTWHGVNTSQEPEPI